MVCMSLYFSSSPDRLSASESSLVLRLFSSASNFYVCSISDRRFFSFATHFLQTYLFSVDRKDISKLSISVATSNSFHPFGSNTLTFLFSMTRQHKLQYTNESDIAFSIFSKERGTGNRSLGTNVQRQPA